MESQFDQTIVADIGARYGMHPTWRQYCGPLKYLMFEPDSDEAARLRAVLDPQAFEIFETALDRIEGERPFYLLRHRGLSSFLKPDLSSECFRRLKPGQAEIDREILLQTRTLDSLMNERGLAVDFIKVDTEGTEHDVLEGASAQLDTSVLGIRSSCNFQPCFHGQKLFSQSHDYLVAKGFVLLNLDYHGYGYPRLGLFRKADPIEPENSRYGILVAADAVWIRKWDWFARSFDGDPDKQDTALLKLVAFCLVNHAPDVGIDYLKEYIECLGARTFSPGLKTSPLYLGLQIEILKFLGRWRTVPDEQWDRVKSIYRVIYGEELPGGSEFYPRLQSLERQLATSR